MVYGLVATAYVVGMFYLVKMCRAAPILEEGESLRVEPETIGPAQVEARDLEDAPPP